MADEHLFYYDDHLEEIVRKIKSDGLATYREILPVHTAIHDRSVKRGHISRSWIEYRAQRDLWEFYIQDEAFPWAKPMRATDFHAQQAAKKAEYQGWEEKKRVIASASESAKGAQNQTVSEVPVPAEGLQGEELGTGSDAKVRKNFLANPGSAQDDGKAADQLIAPDPESKSGVKDRAERDAEFEEEAQRDDEEEDGEDEDDGGVKL